MEQPKVRPLLIPCITLSLFLTLTVYPLFRNLTFILPYLLSTLHPFYPHPCHLSLHPCHLCLHPSSNNNNNMTGSYLGGGGGGGGGGMSSFPSTQMIGVNTGFQGQLTSALVNATVMSFQGR